HLCYKCEALQPPLWHPKITKLTAKGEHAAMANHPIVHIDIPTVQGRDSAEFYAKTFDWKLEHAPEFDYWQFAAEGGPGGGFMQVGEQGAKINQLVVYIGTDDIEDS